MTRKYMIMRRLIVLPFLFLAICCIGQSRVEIQAEIDALVQDSLSVSENIQSQVVYLQEISSRLVYFRALMDDIDEDTATSDRWVIDIALPYQQKYYPIAQPVQYLAAGDEDEKLKPTIVFTYSERVGVASLYYTAASERDFQSESKGGAVQYISGISKEPYTPKKFEGNFARDEYTDGETIQVKIPRPSFGALNENMSLWCVGFIYMNEDLDKAKLVVKWTASQRNTEEWFDLISEGKRKPRLSYYTRHLTSRSDARKYLRALEKRGLDNEEVRTYYNL